MKRSIRCFTPKQGAALFHPEEWPERFSGLISVERQEQDGVLALVLRWPTGVERRMMLSISCEDTEVAMNILHADWVTGEFTLVALGDGVSEAQITLFFFQSMPHSFLLECVAIFEHALTSLGVQPLP